VRRRGGLEDTTDSGFLEALSSALGLEGSAPIGQLGWPERVGGGSNLQTQPFQPSERTKNQELAMLLKQVP